LRTEPRSSERYSVVAAVDGDDARDAPRAGFVEALADLFLRTADFFEAVRIGAISISAFTMRCAMASRTRERALVFARDERAIV